jgi:hypothetical protein
VAQPRKPSRAEGAEGGNGSRLNRKKTDNYVDKHRARSKMLWRWRHQSSNRTSNRLEAGINMPKHDEVMLCEVFRQAFRHRERPAKLSTSSQLTDFELMDLDTISRYDWDKVSAEMWEKHFDIVSLFSAEAFCYYLPGICVASLREQRPDLIVVSNLIDTLDRTPTPAWWDDFFLKRWPHLTELECKAVQDWIWWLTTRTGTSHSEDSLMRALHTLELLINQKTIGEPRSD